MGVSSCTAPIIGGRQPYRLNEERRPFILQVSIDLGGIAKGWVIDLAAVVTALLMSLGISGFLAVCPGR